MERTETRGMVEVFIGRHRSAWGLYVSGWIPPYLRQRLDAHGEAFPAAEPNLAALDRHMWACDAPYTKRVTSLGGIELETRGRSAVALWEWIEGYVLQRQPEARGA